MRPANARLAVLLAPLLMYQADIAIVNVATPAIDAGLHATGAELELVVSGYLVASASLFITGARLGQTHGYRRVFLLGVGLFGLASLACGLAPDPRALIAARVLQGAGGALMVPQVLTGIQLAFPQPATRTRALGAYSLALAAGAVAGQVLGGVLVSADLLGGAWRPIFLVNVPIAVAVVAAGWRHLPADDRDARAHLDLPGAATLSAALLLLVVPLTLGREQHWPAWTWASLVASAPALAAFVAVERRATRRGAAPLLDLRLLARPAIRWGLWPQAIAIGTYYGLLFTLALFLQQGLGLTALASGLILVPWVAAFGVPGRMMGRVPPRLMPALAPGGCLLLAAGYAAISASTLAGERAGPLLVALLAVGGLGLGTAFSAILEHLTAAATPRHAADISGVFTTSLQVAGCVGIAAFGTLYLATDGNSAAQASHAFALVTAVFAVAALVAAAVARRAVRETSSA